MASYTPPDYNTLLPGEPWTSAKAIAAFENLEAFAEQATDAPKMAMKTIVAAAPGALAIADLDAYSGVYVRGYYSASSIGGTSSFDMDLSTDGGATYLTAVALDSVGPELSMSGGFYLFVNFLNGDWRFVRENGFVILTGAFASVADNVTDFRLSCTGSLCAMFEPRGGDAAS